MNRRNKYRNLNFSLSCDVYKGNVHFVKFSLMMRKYVWYVSVGICWESIEQQVIVIVIVRKSINRPRLVSHWRKESTEVSFYSSSLVFNLCVVLLAIMHIKCERILYPKRNFSLHDGHEGYLAELKF